jgi:hypothetical protein
LNGKHLGPPYAFTHLTTLVAESRTAKKAPYKTALYLFLFTLCAAAPLAAQYRGFSLGLGGEVNAVSLREDRGYGASFAAESRLNRWFSIAFLGNASLKNHSTLSDISGGTAFIGLEASTFLRFYILSPQNMQRAGAEVFVGAGGGLLVTMNGTDYRNSRGSPEAAGIAGVRFRLGSNFYLEPYFRGGYPFIGGAGLTLGFRFPARSEPTRIVEVEKTVEVEFSLPDTLAIILRPDSVRLKNVKPPSGDTFSFIFVPNSARFNDLDSAAMRQNEETLLKLLALLKENPSFRLLIEGFTNPRTGNGSVPERQTHRSLNERRAVYIASVIIARGIEAERLIRIGKDRARQEQNRSVEVRLLQ